MKHIRLTLLLAFIAFGCQKEINFESPVPTTTTTDLPTVITAVVSSITNSTAYTGGNITSSGGSTITARGVCWGTAANPVVSGNHTSDGVGGGIFASAITGLTPNTIYYVRAYATNSTGTAYGSDSTFRTTTLSSALPTVTTSPISAISALTASGGGTVVTDGGATVTVRGICWATTANPIATGNHTTDGSGIGSYSGFMTGLTAGTTYHVRAYATNSVGTAYGGDSVFTTTGGSSSTKIKRIIQSVTGTRQAYITAITYDASDRLLTFKEWEEDSTFTPIKITGAHYSAITYNGATAYPVKNTITSETAGVDSTTYSYDASNRVIEEKYYHIGNVSVRNTYSYPSATKIILGKYVLSGPTLLYMGNDTLIFDAQQRITGYNSGNAANVATGTGTYQYDTKNNPFVLIDFFKHAYTLYCDDAKYFYRSPNNFTLFNQSTLPSGSTTININYVAYNAGFYPEYATGSLVNVPGSTQNYTIRYEYY
jgi:hypothetical protein